MVAVGVPVAQSSYNGLEEFSMTTTTALSILPSAGSNPIPSSPVDAIRFVTQAVGGGNVSALLPDALAAKLSHTNTEAEKPVIANIMSYMAYDEAAPDSSKAPLVHSFHTHYIGMIGNKNLPNSSAYPGYAAQFISSTDTPSAAFTPAGSVKTIINTMRDMLRPTPATNGDDYSIASLTKMPPKNIQDTVVNNFNAFVMKATIKLLRQANTSTVTDNSTAISAMLDKVSSSSGMITVDRINTSNSSAVQEFINKHISHSANIQGTGTPGGIFQFYNSLVELDAIANNPATTTYCTRMVMAAKYVLQYYFYMSLLTTLYQSSMADLKAAYNTTSLSTPQELKDDCWLILCRIANLEALIDSDKANVEAQNAVARSFDTLSPDADNVEVAKHNYEKNTRAYNAILSKNVTNGETLKATQWTMFAWFVALLIYIGIFVMLFNVEVPNVSSENKAMGIILINGIAALILIVVETIRVFNSKINS